MKIAFVIDEDISTKTGVVQKIASKMEFWKQYGHEVHLFSLRSSSLETVIKDATVMTVTSQNLNILQKMRRNWQDAKHLEPYLKAYSPDIIYTRQLKYSPNLVTIMKRFGGYIMELNTNDVYEYQTYGRISRIFNLIGRNALYSNAKAFVAVSREIAHDKHYAKFNKPTLISCNGIDFTKIIEHKKAHSASVKNIVFIGSPNQVWHGVDKVVALAQAFPDKTFHIIGPDLDQLENIDGFSQCNNIRHYGYVSSDSAQKIVEACDVGIASLALHRQRMYEASPLKSRQYLAQGLPIIMGYSDTDGAIEELPYVLNIENYENNVIDNLGKIKQFFEQVVQFDPARIIEDVRPIFDIHNKEKKRLEFFRQILEAKQ